MNGEVKSEIILAELNLCKFDESAKETIGQFMANLAAYHPEMKEPELNNIREFICLGAAEAAIVWHIKEFARPLTVGTAEAVISILKGDTTYSMGCPPEVPDRIRHGKLLPEDVFLLHGDYQKFRELDLRVEYILERPFYVANQFLGRLKEIKELYPAVTSIALPCQSLLWKFKLDIINLQKSHNELLRWSSEVYKVQERIEKWPSG